MEMQMGSLILITAPRAVNHNCPSSTHLVHGQLATVSRGKKRKSFCTINFLLVLFSWIKIHLLVFLPPSAAPVRVDLAEYVFIAQPQTARPTTDGRVFAH